MKYLILAIGLVAGTVTASAQESFQLHFDHVTVLVTDLPTSEAFYENILHLEPMATPWGPTAPIRFYALGGSRQLHMGLMEKRIEPNKNIHLAFAVPNFEAYLRFIRD